MHGEQLHRRNAFHVIRRIAFLQLLLCILSVTSASAHTSEASTAPERNSHVMSLPKTVEITFATKLMDIGTGIVVLDPSRKNIVSGPFTVSEYSLSAPISDSKILGTYEVTYRVVSEDGHPVEGRFNFYLGQSSAPTASPDRVTEKSGRTWPNIFLPLAVVLALGIAFIFRRYRNIK